LGFSNWHCAPQIEQSISLYQVGAFPFPGPIMINQGGANAQILTPTLADGVMNEFRFLDSPANTTALSVPIAAGQVFVVSLTFLNQSSGGGPFAPAPTIDQDGCQPFKNTVDVIPGGWVDACPLGVTGDFVIRAVIDCQTQALPTSSVWGIGVLATSLAAVDLAAALRESLGGRPSSTSASRPGARA
jgi:hypothetical protein